MAETSGFHTTNAAGAGHQVASYTEAMMQTAMTIIAACHGREGIAPDYEDELAPSDGGFETVNVAKGGAMVDGMWYDNSAVEGVTVTSAPGGTVRYDRIVIKHTGTPTFTVELYCDAGDAGGPPAAVAGEITVCTVMVDDAGAVTVTDAREFAQVGGDDIADDGVTLAKMADNSVDSDQYVDGSIDAVHIASDAVTTVKILDSNVTAAKIANRTRTFLVDAFYSAGGGLVYSNLGQPMADALQTSFYGYFKVPLDYYSDMTVTALVVSQATGNGYFWHNVQHRAIGEAYNTHSVTVGNTAVALTINLVASVMSVSLPDAAVGDTASISFVRYADNALDTINNTVGIMGFLISYTADS